MIYKRGKFYWYKFMWNGKLVRESTKQGNDKVARNMESAHRTSLAKGEVGIREKKPVPTLTQFLTDRVLPWAEATFTEVPKNLKWYRNEARVLVGYKPLARLTLDKITGESVSDFAASRIGHGKAISTVNSSIRVLRAALNLAVDWRVLDTAPKLDVMSGERRRDHVVTPDLEKASAFLAAVVAILIDTGLRPEECFRMRWENVRFLGESGAVIVSRGKTNSARRAVPMTPRVRDILEARWQVACKPVGGWVWPAPRAKDGHIVPNSIYELHREAIKDSGVRPFVLYSLRHTFLTRLGESGCDAWTLARIAGHSSIAISGRYVHTSDDSALTAMARLVAGGHKSEQVAVASHKSGHNPKPVFLERNENSSVTESYTRS